MQAGETIQAAHRVPWLARVADWLLLGLLRCAILLRHPIVTARYVIKWNQGRIPNPALPATINDKFFWRKFFDRNPEFTRISDKLALRDWLVENGYDIAMAPVRWSGRNAHDIPDETLVGMVVLKANHGSGWNIFLNMTAKNLREIRELGNGFIRKRYGRNRLEWGYFDIERKIFVEEFISEATTEFKIYTFGDRIERLVAIYDRFDEMSADLWEASEDGTLELADRATMVTPNRARRPLPASVERAAAVAAQIGRRYDHMRVDFMTDGKQVWLSELTVYNLGGHISIIGNDPDTQLNQAWDIKKSWFLTTPQTGWRRFYAAALLRRLTAP